MNRKQGTVNTRKRVISFLLSALMVLSIVMPGGSGQVMYNAHAEGEYDLGTYINSITVSTKNGANWEEVSSGTVLNDGTAVQIAIVYTTADGIVTTTNNMMHYTLPATINLETAQTGTVQSGNNRVGTYVIDTAGNVTITYDDDFARDEKSFTGTLTFECTANNDGNENASHFGFTGDVASKVTDVSIAPKDTSFDVKAEKSGVVNNGDGTVTYTVVISSEKGTKDVVNLHDSFSGNNVVTLNLDSVKLDGEDFTVETDWNGGFNAEIPKMSANSNHTLTYTATINTDEVDRLNSDLTINNTMTATSGNNTSNSQDTFNINHTIVSKMVSGNTWDSQYFTYTITVNSAKINLEGKVLQDVFTYGEESVNLSEISDYNVVDEENNDLTSIITKDALFGSGYTFGSDSEHKYTITYKIPIPKNTTLEKKYVNNTVTVDKENSNHENWKSTTSKEIGPISYEVSKIDATLTTDNNLSWVLRIKIPDEGDKLNNFEITDTLGDNQIITKEQAEAFTFKVNGSIIDPNYYTIVFGDDLTAENVPESGVTSFKITFKNTDTNTDVFIKDRYLEIGYESTPDLEAARENLDSDRKYTFNNTAHFKNNDYEIDKTGKYELIDRDIVNKYVKAKDNNNNIWWTDSPQTMDYDDLVISSVEGTGNVQYILRVNCGELSGNKTHILVDTLPSGATIVGSAIVYGDYNNSDTYVNPSNDVYSDIVCEISEEKNILTVRIPSTYESTEYRDKKLNILYTVHYDESSTIGEKRYTNTVVADEEETTTLDLTINTENIQEPGNDDVLSKFGKQGTKSIINEQNDTVEVPSDEVEYWVFINQNSEDLDLDSNYLELEDILTVNNTRINSVELVRGSVHLYNYDADSTDEQHKGTEIASGYSVTLDDKYTDSGYTGKLNVTVPDEKALVLVYKYKIDFQNLAEATEIFNEVNLVGVKKIENNVVEYSVASSSATAGKQTSVTMYKVDSQNINLYLEGAKIKIEYFNDDGSASGTWDTVKDSMEIPINGITFTTDTTSTGSNIINIEPDKIYKITEVDAPVGYSKRSPKYMMFADPNSNDNRTVLESKKNNIKNYTGFDLSANSGVDTDIEYCLGMGNTTLLKNEMSDDEITIQKVWEDSDGSALSTSPISSVTVNVYEQSMRFEKYNVTVKTERYNQYNNIYNQLSDFDTDFEVDKSNNQVTIRWHFPHALNPEYVPLGYETFRVNNYYNNEDHITTFTLNDTGYSEYLGDGKGADLIYTTTITDDSVITMYLPYDQLNQLSYVKPTYTSPIAQLIDRHLLTTVNLTGDTWKSDAIKVTDYSAHNADADVNYYYLEETTIPVDFEATYNDGLTHGNLIVTNTKTTTTTGSLVLKKTFATDSDIKSDDITVGQIKFNVKCESVSYDETFDYTDFVGGTKTISGLKPGTYTVTETSTVEGYNYTRTTTVKVNDDGANTADSADASVAAGGSATVEFTNSYTRKTGSLVLAKAFDATVTNYPTNYKNVDFKVVVTLKDENNHDLTGTLVCGDVTFTNGVSPELTITGNTSKTITGIPYGYKYTVVEQTPTTEGYSIVSGKGTATGSITAATQTATVTNTYSETTGSLVLKKTFATDSDITLTPSTATAGAITFTVAGTNGISFTGSYDYKDFDSDGTKTISGLEPGTYTVTEASTIEGSNYTRTTTVKVDDDEATIAGSTSASVTAGESVTVEFTNNYDENKGNLILRKLFEGEITYPDNHLNETFKVRVTLKDREGTLLSGTKTFDTIYNETNGSITFNNGVSSDIEITGNHTFTIKDIPYGYQYTVEEQDLTSDQITSGYSIVSSKRTATGSITLENQTATVTNTYSEPKGSLVLKKSFATDSDITSTDITTGQIKFHVECATAPYDKIFDYTDFVGGTKTISELKPGTYTVTETSTVEGSDYTRTTTVKVNDGEASTANSANASVTSGGSITVEFNNKYIIKTGEFTVKKEGTTDNTTGDGRVFEDDKPFDITVNFTFPTGVSATGSYTTTENTTPTNITSNSVTFSLKKDQVATFTGIPYGTKYTVSEAAISQADMEAGYQKDSIVYGDGTVNEGIIEDTTNNVNVTVKNKLVLPVKGYIEITKTFTSDRKWSDISSYISFKITDENGDEISGSPISGTADNWSVSADGKNATYQLTELELNKKYKVEEIINGDTKATYYTFVQSAGTNATSLSTNETSVSNIELTDTSKSGSAYFDNNYTRLTGSLILAKAFDATVTNYPTNYKNVDFKVVVTLKDENNHDLTGTLVCGDVTFTNGVSPELTITGNTSKTITGIPYGYKYTVVEQTPTTEGYSIVSGKGTATGSITAATQTATVTNTYSETTGSLVLKKSFVTDSDIKSDDITVGQIKFNVKCESVSYDETFDYTDFVGGTKTISGLKPGTYTVTETSTVEGYNYTRTTTVKVNDDGANTADSADASVAAGGSATVEFTNSYTRKTGSLVLAKAFDATVTNYPTNYKNVDFKVVVTLKDENNHDLTGTLVCGDVTFTNGVSPELTITGNTSKTITGIPYGYKYTVVEQTPTTEGYSIVSGKGTATGSITAATQTATVTNTYSETTGSLVLKKTFASSSDITLTPSTAVAGAITFTVEGTNGITFNNSYDYKDFDSDGTKTISGLEPGAYTVTETSTVEGSNYTRTTTVKVNNGEANTADSAAASVTSGGSATVEFINNYESKTGSFTVTKALTGTGADNNKKFPITVTFTFPTGITAAGTYTTTADNTEKDITANVVTVQLANGETAEFSDIPYGTTYKVSETIPATTDYKGYENATIVYSNGGSQGEITSDDSNVNVTVNNIFIPEGKIVIYKTISGDKSWNEVKANISFKVSNGTAAEDKVISGSASGWVYDGATKTASYTIRNCTLNKTYNITETMNTPTGTVWANYDVKTETGTAQDGLTVSTDRVVNGITINSTTPIGNAYFKNTYTRKTGKLTVVKEFDLTTVPPADYKTVKFDTKITLKDENGELVDGTYGGVKFTNGEAVVQVSVNSSKEITGIPYGYKYTVKEQQPSDGYQIVTSGSSGTISGSHTVKMKNKYSPASVSLTINKLFGEESDIKSSDITDKDIIVFTITGPDDYSNTIDYYTFKDAGSITISDLSAGEYTITESSYIPDSEYNRTTKVKVESGSEAESDIVSVDISAGDNASVTFTNNYTVIQKAELDITKVVSGVNAGNKEFKLQIKYTNGKDTKYIAVASDSSTGYKLVDDVPAGNAVPTVKSGETLKIKGIPFGTYTVTEDTGSVGLSDYVFVSADSTVTGSAVIKANETKTVILTNVYTENRSVKISKVDFTDGTPLSGAKLQLLYGNDIIETWTTDGSIKTISGLKSDVTYTLHEISAPDGYTLISDVDFMIGTDNVVTFTSDISDEAEYDDTSETIELKDKKTSVKISKVDVTSQEELSGAVIEIIDEEGNVVESWTSTDTPHEITGLKTGVTYTLRETVAPDGYQLTTDTEFVLNDDGSVNGVKTTTAISKEGILLVEDAPLGVLIVNKQGLYNELCSEDRDATKPLEGVKFELTRPGDSVFGQVKTTDVDGIVTFSGLEPGTYELKEIQTIDNYVLDNQVYTVKVNADGSVSGLIDASGKAVENNIIINDEHRTDISFVKVNLGNKDEKLPGSTYGLYKKDADNKLIKIAEATTDSEGVLKFEGVLTDVEYTVRELVSPGGFYVSENPITISFRLNDDGEVVIDKIDDGNGTILLSADGGITWLEPEIRVSFLKQDLEGHNLAGAKLKVVDANGKDILSWTSTTDAYVVDGVFVAGETYSLVEVEAPEGYAIADPVSFTIEEKAGADGADTISVIMKDAPKITTTITPPETPPAPETGDNAPVKPAATMMMSSLAGLMYLMLMSKRHRRRIKR